MGKEVMNETPVETASEQSLNEQPLVENENPHTDAQQIPVFGYDLIREYLLNEILGQDAAQLLYWGGKQLARKFPLHSVEDICVFFHSAGWGTLTQKKLSKDESIFELSGDGVSRRLSINEKCHFQLEAGFLAQQFELQKKVSSEAIEELKKRTSKVTFIVKWDPKDSIY
ncbi:putative hydrocarbon binding protein [Peribacillus deserti]|uniref:Hydrocarbon binding protein n=1 Tax=Peribacillus deserti TaxID=673318 RepID=A0ABS2QFX0_9BACI|nr:YslB family protein [Peribacillus deserti]MBM7691992.1 putative hydrocarbon binding protein [Peribacillus deserti]